MYGPFFLISCEFFYGFFMVFFMVFFFFGLVISSLDAATDGRELGFSPTNLKRIFKNYSKFGMTFVPLLYFLSCASFVHASSILQVRVTQAVIVHFATLALRPSRLPLIWGASSFGTAQFKVSAIFLLLSLYSSFFSGSGI